MSFEYGDTTKKKASDIRAKPSAFSGQGSHTSDLENARCFVDIARSSENVPRYQSHFEWLTVHMSLYPKTQNDLSETQVSHRRPIISDPHLEPPMKKLLLAIVLCLCIHILKGKREGWV